MSEELEPIRSSMVQYKIGNHTYDMVRKRNCATCMHPARLKIEAKLLLNYGYPAVSRYVSELNSQKRDGTIEEWPELSVGQIRNHFEKGHCPIEGEVLRNLATQRAEERGIDLATSMEQYVDHVIVKQAVLMRGYELLMESKIEPDVKDLLAAAKALGDGEKDVNLEGAVQQWQDFMSVYFQVVQTIVSREQWEEIISKLNAHPVFKQMQTTNDEDIIDAEEV